MALLLYKSNEMFSSTELIRKSKMIFDKILGRKIEKAIILRDGKPSFLLMEFSKYEKIMAEYEELKEYVERIEESTVPKKKKKSKKEKSEDDKKLKEELVANSKRIAIAKMDYVADIEKKNIEKEDSSKAESEQLVAKTEENESEDVVEEISEAFSSIDSMNLDNDTKQEAKEKIKAKILEARKERETMKHEDPEQKKEEEQLEEQIAQEKLKKEQELKEFWD